MGKEYSAYSAETTHQLKTIQAWLRTGSVTAHYTEAGMLRNLRQEATAIAIYWLLNSNIAKLALILKQMCGLCRK